VENIEVHFRSKSTGVDYTGRTSSNGQLIIRLPVDMDFLVDLPEAPGSQEINIPDDPMLINQYELVYDDSYGKKLHPNLQEALVNVRFIDLFDRPVPGETVSFTGNKSSRSFQVLTDESGEAQVLLPLGDEYRVDTKYFKKIGSQKFEPSGLQEVDYTIRSISSSDWEERERQRERELAIRDSLAPFYDTLLWKWNNYFPLDDTIQQMLIEHNLELMRKDWKYRVEHESRITREGLTLNPRFLEDAELAVAAVFDRIGEDWKYKTIVMDLTCSMDPYAREVLLWTTLKQIEGERKQYLFFNDGNGMANEDKRIGETGGFHAAGDVELDSLLGVMFQAKRFGCSGDRPENDLEALLEGSSIMHPTDELILIADNLSSVRDIELMDRLQTPVRIILCGVTRYIHPQYLKIARYTGGSVHTIEEDIMDLAKLAEGESIVIKGQEYVFTAGNFFRK
jgi:hypothetical protein